MAGDLRTSQTAARPIDEVSARAGRLDEYRPAQCPSGTGRAPRPSGLEITAPLRWHLVTRQRQPGSPMRCWPRRRIGRWRPSPRRCSGPSSHGCARRGTAGWRCVGDLLRVLRVEVVTRVLDHLVAAQPSWWQTNDRGGLSLQVRIVRIIAAHHHRRRAPAVGQLCGGLLWQFATVLFLWP